MGEQLKGASLTQCIRVEFAQDPKESAEGPVGRFLQWIIDGKIPSISGGYAGPMGCVRYFPIEVEPQVTAWMRENIPNFPPCGKAVHRPGANPDMGDLGYLPDVNDL